MSGGYKSGPPTDIGELIRTIAQLKADVAALKLKQLPSFVGQQTSNVVIADSSGQKWQLGVTTSGATTWTSVS